VDASSKDERVVFVPSSSIKALTLGGRAQVFDTGERSSLVALGQKALGLDQTAPTFVTADLRPRRATCLGGIPSSQESAQGALGTAVVADPQPPRARAEHGEPPIESQATPRPIAELARLYQPTLEVSAADRNWPVSVGAILADIGPAGEHVCLVQKRHPKHKCPPSPSDLSATGSASADYLQYPVHLRSSTSPNSQIEAFQRGEGLSTGPLEHWLAEPAALEPWRTAQMYFYYVGSRTPDRWPAATRDARLPEHLETLEYWFFYQYNYFPLLVRSNLMQDAPVAADVFDVDFHQGDWEHVDVLLDPETHMPLWLYLARHSDEGTFIPWGSAPMVLDGTHPIIRAAFGGHPSYPPRCGAQPRAKTLNTLSDWLVCGPQFAFFARTTPLVDLARTPWACWSGHFGEAVSKAELRNAAEPESVLDKLKDSRLVAGPPSPLRQAENSDVCKGGGEQDAIYPEMHRR
jgi:hypothetical protein